MARVARYLLLALAPAFAAGPGVAGTPINRTGGGVQVIGSSPGYSCYRAAAANSSSAHSLNTCNMALSSGELTFEDEVATYVNRGIVKLLGGRVDESIADFDRATSMNPRQPEAYLNKGSALLKKREASQAIGLFDQALERGTSRPELAYYSRAVAHEDAGNIEAAYRDYQKAREVAPKWALPAQELGRFQVRRAAGTSL